MNSPRKLLLISLSAGAGHVRAAEAIRETAKKEYPRLAVEHIDMMDYVTLPMKSAIMDSYDLMIKRLPELWGFLYKKINEPGMFEAYERVTRAMKRMNSHALYRYIQKSRPDHIICTHSLPADVISQGREQFNLAMPVSLVVTDYDMHALWFVPDTAYYFVGTPKIAWKLEHRGVEKEHIVESGVPIDPVFYQKKNIAKLKQHYRLPLDQKIILLLAGGQGSAKSDEILALLANLTTPATIIAIAGKNKKLAERLRAVKLPPTIKRQVVGWTDRIDEYMCMADVIITKPGGATTTECVTLHKPIIVTQPIPGQEEYNTQYIQEHGYGVVARSTEDLLYYAAREPYLLAPGYTLEKQKTLSRRGGAEIILKKIFY
ncbi:MAG: hypothetical protein HY984_01445 [Candidatus Magasanikbacteria bacterium]|nr:hypothetical protein [Candidatus Magasanikbacteria bacterium]